MFTKTAFWAALVYCAVAPAQTPQFNRDIRPILSDRCLSCHGTDAAAKGIRLRLDREDSAKGDLGGGRRAIVPGHPEQSILLHRIQADNKALRMPPAATGKVVTEKERQVLTEWIRAGAEWQKHWAFIPPSKTAVPSGVPAIDSFVRERLRKEGLQPSEPADRYTLIRRASFDITGLPPSLEEVDAFVNDASPNAYERLVDRLLASPAFGERMAMRWLDAARYADTNGYQTDAERSMHRWRDWVIDAFQRDLPFDQFITWQLAGDLLPDAMLSQRIATGFNRNHRGNSEGGIVPEEYLVEYAADRMETMATVFLGLTVGCARCHNHKYDPILQKEYYQLFGYFNHIGEPGRYLKYGNSPPMLAAPTKAEERRLHELRAAAAEASGQLAKLEPKIAKAQELWEKSAGEDPVVREDLRSILDLKKVVFDGKSTHNAGDHAQFGFLDKFTIAFRMMTRTGEGVIFHRMQGSENYSEGYGMNLENGRIQAHFAVRRLDDAILVQTAKPMEKNRWYHVTLTYDGSRYASGVKIYIDGEPAELDVQLDALNQDFKRPGVLTFGSGGGWPSVFEGSLDDFRSYGREFAAPEVAMLAVKETPAQIAIRKVRTPAQQRLLRQLFFERAATPEIRGAREAAKKTSAAAAEFEASIPTVMVMAESAQPADTHVLLRGAYDKPGEKVSRAVPAALHSLPAGAPANRLGLAQWLTSKENPLTARVTVNRFWQMLFGTGLVKTAEDFGAQGDWPSHPELLDWLAVDFVESGWSVKGLFKKILMSETYRQSSRASKELRERDPENRLLARGPRYRLPAEMVRDQALKASGLLVEKIGGPPVKPYQPAGLWVENGGGEYKQDHGESLYRRSLYTFWRRTSPPPFLATFDSALRESCTVREGRTNTPLQALHLLNDVQFLEAARALAQKTIRQGGASTDSRIRFAFRTVLARPPRSKEMEALQSMLAYSLDRYRTDPKRANEFLAQGESQRDSSIDAGEHAAWMAVTSMILNLDAAVTKE